MNIEDQDRTANLLRQALPRMGEDAEPVHDLWPVVLRRLDRKAAMHWLDWALLAGLGAMAAAFPAWIPVLLYYL